MIICDDGLQHYRLYRDVEIAVLDDRGVGNGWCLPAGPLREPPKRLNTVSAVVHHRRLSDACASALALSAMPWMPQPLTAPQFEVCSSLNSAYALTQVERTMALSEWASVLGDVSADASGQQVLMLAGIAQPQVFFRMLADAGIRGATLALPDHAPFDTALAERLMRMVQENLHGAILMTEKDAVKCLPWVRTFPELAEKIWVVPLSVQPNEGWQALSQFVSQRLHELTQNPEV